MNKKIFIAHNGGAMSSAGLETTKLSNYDEVNK